MRSCKICQLCKIIKNKESKNNNNDSHNIAGHFFAFPSYAFGIVNPEEMVGLPPGLWEIITYYNVDENAEYLLKINYLFIVYVLAVFSMHIFNSWIYLPIL